MTTIMTIGRIVKDFELRKSEKNGSSFATFSLAVNQGFGEKQKTLFFECIAFGVEAERLIKAKAQKGSLIQVVGRFGTSDFTRGNGEPGYSLNIAVLSWNYIPGTNGGNGTKGANGGNGGNTAESGASINNQAPQQHSQAPQQNPQAPQLNELPPQDYRFDEGFMNLDDDDLPF